MNWKTLKETPGGKIIELSVVLVLAVGAALLIQSFLVKPYRIPSGSMEPTLDINQRILVSRFVYHFADPEPGDVVVFHPPAGVGSDGEGCGVEHSPRQSCPEATQERSDETFVKRIVAGPGDQVAVKDGLPVVNGAVVRPEGYEITHCENPMGGCDLPQPITVPEGHFFMMGDNRGESEDSRFWGPLPEEWIIGKAFGTYWPPNRLGGL